MIRGAFAGCCAYLAKPVDDEDLRRTVIRQLGGNVDAARRPGRLRLVDAPAIAAR